MTITYDSEGKCTRCGSTGWLPVAKRHPGDHPQTHATIFSVKPCPCHGWRPIEFAPKGEDIEVDLLMPVEAFGERRSFAGKWDNDRYAKKPLPYWRALLVEFLWGVRFMRRHQPTHFRPRPQPPEVE